jgi:hypothetical protein
VLALHRSAARLPDPVLRSLFGSPALRTLAMGMILTRPDQVPPSTPHWPTPGRCGKLDTTRAG